MREIQSWISDDELSYIKTSSYWNNIEEEKKKPWWIEDGDYKKCINYLKSSKLLYEYQKAEKYVKEYKSEKVKIADIAAGIGWTSALLSKLPIVEEVHAVEISRHRLDSLFEHSIKMFQGEENKIYRYLGNFYELRFPERSIDIIFMSQAFHHANKPLKLLVECDRVLKDGGRIILVGENHMGIRKVIRRFLSILIKQKKVITNFYQMFSPDKILGDHYYRHSDYYLIFNLLGYIPNHEKLDSEHFIYIADKNPK